MKFNFAKTLLMSTALTMGAFGLVACGDDNGPTKVKIPTENDANIKIVDPEVVIAGPTVKFDGTIAVDNNNPDIPQDAEFLIDSLKYVIANSKLEETKVVPTYTAYKGGKDKVSLSGQDVTVMLNDPAFGNECGTYSLVVYIYAHLDKTKKTSTIKIDFERSAALYCKEAVASSSSNTAAGIEMIPYEVTMSTDKLPGLDLATGKASNSTTADIVLVKTSDGVNVTSGNGTLFSMIANEDKTPNNYDDDYDVNMWPEDENNRNAYVSDFMYKNIAQTKITIVDGGTPSISIYVAKTAAFNEATGAGFFAFAATSATSTLNGDFDVTLKVYKKK